MDPTFHLKDDPYISKVEMKPKFILSISEDIYKSSLKNQGNVKIIGK